MPVTAHEARPPGDPSVAAADPVARLQRLVGYARLAPTAGTARTWRFEIGDGMVRLFLEEPRGPVARRSSRGAHLGVGAALEHLLVAAEQDGLRHTVSYFPKAHDPALVATVTFADGGTPTRVPRSVTPETLCQRRTERGEFRILTVPIEVTWQLHAVALDRDVRLDLTDNPMVKRECAELTARAGRDLRNDRAWRRELIRGLDLPDLGFPRLAGAVAQLTLTHFDLGAMLARREARRLLAGPLIGVVSSRFDDPFGWVRSGQLLDRVWLEACVHGLSVQPAILALEVRDCRAALARLLLPGGFYPHAVVRIGYAARASEQPAPVRGVIR